MVVIQDMVIEYLEMYFSSNVSKVELFKVTWDA
jgi:hypothetical protein